ncbi:hypothetical protein ABZ667_43760 [Streptomyces lavendulae]|uniref:hypothetical protein n=1 Tax=Streptomyces lavendulae TaxID=1914 RepID=UPI0033F6BA58
MSDLVGDARHLSPSAQEALRLRAVAALVAGQAREDVAAIFGVPLKAVDGLVGEVAGQRGEALVMRPRASRWGCTRSSGRPSRPQCGRRSSTAALLEATPDLEALSFYPHLLAWDLEQLPPKKKITPVILLDTFEDTAYPTPTPADFDCTSPRSSPAPSPTSPPTNATSCVRSPCWTPSTSTSPPAPLASPSRPRPDA